MTPGRPQPLFEPPADDRAAWLDTLFQASPMGIGVTVDRVWQEVNDQLCAMTGYERNELIGRSTRILHPNEAQYLKVGEAVRRLSTTNKVARIQATLRRKDGEVLDIALCLALLDPRHPERGTVSTALDITDYRRVETLLRTRLALSERADAGDLRGLAEKVLGTAAGLSRSTAARLRLYQGADGHPNLDARLTDDGDGLRLRTAHLAEHISDHSASDTETQPEPSPDTGARKLGVPIRRDGRLLALLETSGKEAPYGERDHDTLTQLASMAIDATEAMRTDAALRHSEALLRTTLEHLPVGVWSVDADGRVRYGNTEAQRIWGGEVRVGPERCHLLHVTEAATGRVPAPGDWSVLRALRHGETVRDQELDIDAFDGVRRRICASSIPIRDPNTGAITGALVVNQDLSERRSTEAALADARERLELAADGGGLGLYQLNLVTGEAQVDHRYLAMLGYAPGEIDLDLATWRELIHPDDLPRMEAAIARLLDGEDVRTDAEYRMRHKSGDWRWVLDRARVHARSADGSLLGVAGMHLDITERRAAEERLRQSARVFESTAEGVIITDRDSRILAVNPAFSAITGYSEDEVRGRTPSVLSSGRHDAAFYAALWQSLVEHGQWRGEIYNRRKNGEVYPEWLTISAVYDEQRQPTHYVGVFTDISELKRSQADLNHLAHHDPLTGLPNRLKLKQHLHEAVDRAVQRRERLALLFLDLDGFKGINDSLGHAVGDRLLTELGQRMRQRLRAGDVLGRLGGDEFLLVLEEAVDEGDAEVIAKTLLQLIAEPVRVDNHQLFVSASIGISRYPEDSDNAETLLRQADLAMYRAKELGRNRFTHYQHNLGASAEERHRLENALRGALGRGELALVYQPQVDLTSGRLIGVEALVRWTHPHLGVVPPPRFIPVAEEIGLIGAIGEWVLGEACRQLAQWRAHGLLVSRMAVNCSVQQIEDRRLAASIEHLLDHHGLVPGDLEVEITESMLMRRSTRGRETLDNLRRLGITLAVDDFGTGYSSLGRLRHLPIDRLKIDRTFVAEIDSLDSDLRLARAIIGLSADLGLEVIAEGVERPFQAATLLREGCFQAQGWLFGRPERGELLERRIGPDGLLRPAAEPSDD